MSLFFFHVILTVCHTSISFFLFPFSFCKFTSPILKSQVSFTPCLLDLDQDLCLDFQIMDPCVDFKIFLTAMKFLSHRIPLLTLYLSVLPSVLHTPSSSSAPLPPPPPPPSQFFSIKISVEILDFHLVCRYQLEWVVYP